MPTSAKRFDLVELVSIACFVAVATAVAWNLAFWVEPHDKYTIDPRFHTEFLKRYGPERYSSGLEEYIIRDFFQDRRDGVFVDVGAYHAREHSNTYRLERDLGWHGLAIDANASFASEYPQHRPHTRFITAFVGATDTGTGTLHVYEREPIVASGDPSFTAEWGKPTKTMTAPNRTLNSLLSEYGIARVDFVSMDIETGEPAALAGFAITSFKPALVCIEAHYPVRQQILDYFARAGYVLVGKYAQADPLNYYFAPLGTAPAP